MFLERCGPPRTPTRTTTISDGLKPRPRTVSGVVSARATAGRVLVAPVARSAQRETIAHPSNTPLITAQVWHAWDIAEDIRGLCVQRISALISGFGFSVDISPSIVQNPALEGGKRGRPTRMLAKKGREICDEEL